MALALLALLSVTAPASAHTELVRSDPRDGQTLGQAPQSVALTFSDDIAAEFAGVTLSVSGSEPAELPTRTQGPEVVAEIPEGAAGSWRLAYRVVSADGHPISGTIGFTVTASSPTVSDTPGGGAETPAPEVATESPADGSGSSSDPHSRPLEAADADAGAAWPLFGGLAAVAAAVVAAVALVLLRGRGGAS